MGKGKRARRRGGKKALKFRLGNEDWMKLKNRSGAGPHRRKMGEDIECWEEDWELYEELYGDKN